MKKIISFLLLFLFLSACFLKLLPRLLL
ncbi:MAG: lipoprotein [Thermoplasmata archaeon]